MKIENLEDLLVMKLTALYDMESEIVKAMPKIAKKVEDGDLKKSLEMHIEETKVHRDRLELIFKMLDIKPKKTKVEAIRGLLADTQWIIDQKPALHALDAAIIASVRYIEHYEMAGYLSAVAWADLLGYESAADFLRQTLAEEENAEGILSEAAEAGINEQAITDEIED